MKNNIVLIAFYDLNSFSIRMLHTVLRRAGFNVYSIFFKKLNLNNTMDYPTDKDINVLIKLIKSLDPILVAMSVRSALFKLASRVTVEIRKEVSAPIIWGGVHPTIDPNSCINVADIVCIGEGEEAIKELATKITKKEEIRDIQNLWIRNKNKIIKNNLRSLQDLDSLPFTDFSNENKYFIDSGNILPLPLPDQVNNYWIMTSRGCPFSCTYCSNNILREIYKGRGQYVRRRSVENVIEELMQAKKMFKNLNFVIFEDDVFTFDFDWIKKFCEEYKKNIDLPFFCYCHPKFSSEEIIKLLKDAGVREMAMGIQTGSEIFRNKYYERYDTNKEIIEAAKILHKYKINCSYDIIMDNPLENESDKRETFSLLMNLPRPFELCTHTLTHFPNTKFTNLLLQKNIISEKDVENQKEESYKRWTPSLDLKRNKENLFWDVLYFLIKKRYVPRGFIKWLSFNIFFRRHPEPLAKFLKLISTDVFTVEYGSKLDSIRWHLILIFRNPRLLFEKRSWSYIRRKINSK